MTATNTFGRVNVLPLTNKSGGSVAAGDVVIIDSANSDSFTTTTTASYTKSIGIAQQTIANNAVGLVLISGYAALVNVNASVTRGNFGATHTVAKQATDAGSSRAAGTFCIFLTGGTTPDAFIWQPDLGGGSGMTNPMTTTGDMIYSSSGSTPARLAVGNAGGVVAMSNGVPSWNAGTSFPGTPATNDRYFRTDRGLEYFYDGTRWLTTELFEIFAAIPTSGLSASATISPAFYPYQGGTYDMWLVDARWVYQISTTHSGTQYWQADIHNFKNGTDTTVVSLVSDKATVGSYVNAAATTIGSLTGTDRQMLYIVVTKVSTPGTIVGGVAVRYRLVG